jgi:hypothetical protein
MSGHYQALPKIIQFFTIVFSCFSFLGFSTSVVILQEWDSEERKVLHIYPTKVGRVKRGTIPPQCHDFAHNEGYTAS